MVKKILNRRVFQGVAPPLHFIPPPPVVLQGTNNFTNLPNQYEVDMDDNGNGSHAVHEAGGDWIWGVSAGNNEIATDTAGGDEAGDGGVNEIEEDEAGEEAKDGKVEMFDFEAIGSVTETEGKDVIIIDPSQNVNYIWNDPKHPPCNSHPECPCMTPLWTGQFHDSVKVDGLYVINNFVNQTEQDLLIGNIKSLTGWDNLLGRRAIQFGWRYHHSSRKITPISGPNGSIPPAFDHLVRRVTRLTGARFNQMIINQYSPSQGIKAHVDSFSFGPLVVSISLNEDCIMSFEKTRSQSNGPIWYTVRKRSALILSGDARYKWSHEIVRGPDNLDNDGSVILSRNSTRWSITLRFVNPNSPDHWIYDLADNEHGAMKGLDNPLSFLREEEPSQGITVCSTSDPDSSAVGFNDNGNTKKREGVGDAEDGISIDAETGVSIGLRLGGGGSVIQQTDKYKIKQKNQ